MISNTDTSVAKEKKTRNVSRRSALTKKRATPRQSAAPGEEKASPALHDERLEKGLFISPTPRVSIPQIIDPMVTVSGTFTVKFPEKPDIILTLQGVSLCKLLAIAFGRANAKDLSMTGIACAPSEAFEILSFDGGSRTVSARLKEGTSTMKLPVADSNFLAAQEKHADEERLRVWRNMQAASERSYYWWER